MGLFSFAKSVGRKLGITNASPEQVSADANRRRDEGHQDVAAALKAAVAEYGLDIRDLVVSFAAGTATLTGTAGSQADKEKAVLVVGNTQGVEQVDDQIEVEVPELPAIFHTVETGDTLSAIAADQYGVMRMFDVIFEANTPMLKHPDEIYSGQVLRIPRAASPSHTVMAGETLGTIAKHWYGKPARYGDVFEANRNVLSDPNVIRVGQVLRIPASGPAVDESAGRALS